MSKGMLGILPLANISGPVGSLIEALASDNGEEVLAELKKFNRRESCWVGIPQDVDVEIAKDCDPKKFYQNNDFLSVDSDFVNWIVSAAKPVVAGKKFNKASFRTLDKLTTGNELLEEYPKDVWDSTDFCVWLAMKLTKQSKGQKGTLSNNGNYNLFLVRGINQEVFVVLVTWLSVAREWSVNAWTPITGWRSGRRFFSKPINL